MSPLLHGNDLFYAFKRYQRLLHTRLNYPAPQQKTN
jgi:hypothetical protein